MQGNNKCKGEKRQKKTENTLRQPQQRGRQWDVADALDNHNRRGPHLAVNCLSLLAQFRRLGALRPRSAAPAGLVIIAPSAPNRAAAGVICSRMRRLLLLLLQQLLLLRRGKEGREERRQHRLQRRIFLLRAFVFINGLVGGNERTRGSMMPWSGPDTPALAPGCCAI